MGEPAADGSTLTSTWVDAGGDGSLAVGPGEPLVDRTKLAEGRRVTRELARIVHLSDAHVLDASSPARVPFLARFGPPLESTFRPHEALTAHVLRGAVNAARAEHPDIVIQGGDLIDNAQHNELVLALTLLNGGRVRPGSGPDGYHGVQLASNPDSQYYRPDLDAPLHRGLLRRAVRPFTSRGLGIDWLPVLGDHDALVQGELVPSPLTRRVAVGDRALWQLPSELPLPTGAGAAVAAPDVDIVERFVEQALAGASVRVPADPGRRQLDFAEVLCRLRDGGRMARRSAAEAMSGGAPAGLDLVRDLGPELRLVALDLVRRDGGSGGRVQPAHAAWLRAQIAGAGTRWVIVISHHPIEDCEGGDAIFAVLDRSPRVIAALAGHTHRHRIIPRTTPAGGYWLITTGSLIDFPQQGRALRVYATEDGGVAIRTWTLDHVGDGQLGAIARELSRRHAGERAAHLTGTRWDRNATLFRPAAAAA